MKPVHHIALSTIILGVLYAIFKLWGLAIASLFAGVFIDIDHIFDYIAKRGFHFNRNEFLFFFYEEELKKITTLFHGWEYLLAQLLFLRILIQLSLVC